MNSEVSFSEFVDKFQSECISFQENEMGQGLEQSFIHCSYDRTEHSEIGDLITVFIDGKVGTSRIKVEGFRYDDDDQTLVLVTSLFDFFKQQKVLTSSDLVTLANRVRTFFKLLKDDKDFKIIESLHIDYSTPEYDAIDEIKNSHIERLTILIFTDYSLSERIKLLSIDPVYDIPVSIELWDLKRLYEIESLNGAREPKIYSFKDSPLSLSLASEGEGFKSYIGAIPATLLATMYKNSGSRLLEGNVRSFLSSTTAVNKQIRNSIKNNPEKFFILNNGIAVTARNLKFSDTGLLIEATDFQIINGGQTTATLSKAVYVEKIDVSRASVAIKLTEITDDLTRDEADQMVIAISRASNSQNKISDADFFSNHPFHVDMEKKSERLITPALNSITGTFWYYERSKGSYKQKVMFSSKGQQKSFESRYPKKQIIKKEDLARVWLCWKDPAEPNIVSKGAASLFSRFSKIIDEKWINKDDTGVFSDEYYKNTVSLIILLRDLKESIKQSKWYDGGYLANIATYTISLLAEHVKSELGQLEMFDLSVIWLEQSVSSDLLEKLTNLAEEVMKCITSPDQGYANVTQWCKQEKCWIKLRDSFSSRAFLHDLASRYILSKDKLSEKKKTNKKEAKIDKGINFEIEAINYTHWKEAYQFDTHNHILAEKWQKAIYSIAYMQKYNEFNCKYALEGLKKLREEGFEF